MMNDKNDNSKKKHKNLKWWLLGLLVVIVLAVGLIPTDYYIESPGSAFPVSDFIQTKQKKYNNFDMVTVSVTRDPATVFQYLWSYTQPYDERIPSKELMGNESNSQYEELQNWYMETSQQTAIYYAAKKAKLKPKLHYQGVYVMDIQKNSSFKGKLQIGDTIVGADGHKFKSTKDMMTYLNSRPLNSKVKIQIIRNNKHLTYSGKIVKLKDSDRKGIGIQLVEHLTVSTNPKLKINAGDIGGPSAGLMFTLSSYEVFSKQNLTKNHKVAGTGTIDVNGKVGIIGGVDKKVVAASRAGAEVFFAPTDTTGVKKSESNYLVAKRTAKKIHTKMKIVPVGSFDDALNYLKKHY